MTEFITVNLIALIAGAVVGYILGKFLYDEPPWSAS